MTKRLRAHIAAKGTNCKWHFKVRPILWGWKRNVQALIASECEQILEHFTYVSIRVYIFVANKFPNSSYEFSNACIALNCLENHP